MSRTITVKGTGKVSARPDYVVLSMTLETLDKDYDKAMDTAAQQLQQLNDALIAAGFEKSSIKTTGFNVRADYSHENDGSGRWSQIFKGYAVSHSLKLEFDLDMKRLSDALNAASGCLSHPQLSIAFTVKDPTAINEELLRSAAANARRKAEILCEASGVQLGSLTAIDYNWNELNVFSATRYSMTEGCADGAPMAAKAMDITPDDIDLSDTAAFVWEIIQE